MFLVNICVLPLSKTKKLLQLLMHFKNFFDESGRKPDKIWVDSCSEFYNRSMKSWLQDNVINTYSTYNERKSVFAERFIKILKDKV